MRSPEQKERARKNAVNMLSSGPMNTTNTSIQRVINNILDKNNIKYINEYNCKYYAIDNYLTEHNLMIEVMGDYWHSSPIKYNHKGLLNSTQLDRVHTDKRKRSYLKNKYGINVLYLWEGDIRKDPKKCELLIKQYISSNGVLDSYHSFNYYIDKSKGIRLKNKIIKPYFQRLKIS